MPDAHTGYSLPIGAVVKTRINMIDLYTLEQQYWPDKSIPRNYKKENGTLLTKQEAQDIITEIIDKDLIDIQSEDSNTLFITIDDDDYSAFTIFINLIQKVLPNVSLTYFRELDEIMECTYVSESSDPYLYITNLVTSTQEELNKLKGNNNGNN